MPNVRQPMAQVAQVQPTMESLVDVQADQQPQKEDSQMPYVLQPMARSFQNIL
jgi:hypothetical protein